MAVIRNVLNSALRNKRKLVIQPASRNDYSKISEIHRTSFNRGWSDGEIEKLLSQDAYHCLIAHMPGNSRKSPFGYVLFRQILDEAEIISVATKSNARRKGIARQLMDAVVRKLQSDRAKTLSLEVDIQNLPALQLYKGMGFEEIGTRDGYYPQDSFSGTNPSSALVMQLELG